MKLIVNEMPKTAQECMFSANGTGKYRCRNDAKLCPINRGGVCPYLMVAETPSIDSEMIEALFEKRIKITETGAEIETVIGVPTLEPKKCTTKKSTAKKAE